MDTRTCFLAGAMINDADKWEDRYAIKWRKDAYKYFGDHIDNICVSMPPEFWNIDPDYSCDGKETLRFDMRNIRESDIVLVNLKDVASSVSTCDEIFYAYISQKPIVGFGEDEDMEGLHPWVKEQITKIFTGKKSMKQAIDYIATYYT